MLKKKIKNLENNFLNCTQSEQYRFFFENAADSIFIADPKTRKIMECNKTALRLMKYSRKEIISMKADDLHPKDKVKEAMNGFINQFKKGGVLRTEILTKNKKRVPVSINTSIIKIGNKRYIQGVFRDITNVVKYESILKDSENRFHGLFESANDAIWLMNKSTFIDCNSRAVEMFNCDNKADMVNHTPIQFSPIKQPDGQSSKKKALIYISRALSGHPQRFYWQHKKKDGSLFDAEISLNKIILQDKTYLQAIGRDITERKKLEQAKNDFLSMASHQLRTPLSAVKWLLESLENDKNFTPQQREKLRNLMISNERIITLVNYLLDATKIESGKLIINKKFVKLDKLFNKISLVFKDIANSKGKEIKINIPSKIKNIYCDPIFLSQAISNLLHNAIIYGDIDSKDIILKIIERKEDYLISIHNDGFIDSETLNKIRKFDKFVRGDKSSEIKPEGSGLGLYLARSIINASGGKLWCESDIKSGTTFYLTIIKEKTKR